MRNSFTTEMSLVSDDFEIDYIVEVTGNYNSGYRGDRSCPPEGASFEIESIKARRMAANNTPESPWFDFPKVMLKKSALDALEEMGIKESEYDDREDIAA